MGYYEFIAYLYEHYENKVHWNNAAGWWDIEDFEINMGAYKEVYDTLEFDVRHNGDIYINGVLEFQYYENGEE